MFFDFMCPFSVLPAYFGFSLSSFLIYSMFCSVVTVCFFIFLFVFFILFFSFNYFWMFPAEPSCVVSLDNGSTVVDIDFFSYGCIFVPVAMCSFMLGYSISSFSFFSMPIGYFFSVHVTSYQWGWSFFYPFLEFGYEAMQDLKSKDLSDSLFPLFLPASVPVLIVTSSLDVMHSFSVDALGVKFDCVPGHLNSFVICSEFSGVVFGFCSEFCGVSHSFMCFSMEFLDFFDFLDVCSCFYKFNLWPWYFLFTLFFLFSSFLLLFSFCFVLFQPL